MSVSYKKVYVMYVILVVAFILGVFIAGPLGWAGSAICLLFLLGYAVAT